MTFHNPALARLVPDGHYRADDLARVEAALSDHQTLTFVRLPSGLYSASSAGEVIAATGYANVWVRDNIYVAFAHHATGARHIATEVVGALIGFFTGTAIASTTSFLAQSILRMWPIVRTPSASGRTKIAVTGLCLQHRDGRRWTRSVCRPAASTP